MSAAPIVEDGENQPVQLTPVFDATRTCPDKPGVFAVICDQVKADTKWFSHWSGMTWGSVRDTPDRAYAARNIPSLTMYEREHHPKWWGLKNNSHE